MKIESFFFKIGSTHTALYTMNVLGMSLEHLSNIFKAFLGGICCMEIFFKVKFHSKEFKEQSFGYCNFILERTPRGRLYLEMRWKLQKQIYLVTTDEIINILMNLLTSVIFILLQNTPTSCTVFCITHNVINYFNAWINVRI